MRKTVYSGPAVGFYTPRTFRQFIQSRRGIETVVQEEIPPAAFGNIRGERGIYHLSLQHATLHYACIDTREKDREDEVKVRLFGNKKGIGNVERIVHQGEREHRISRRA